ncbi:hypothetical protein GCM10007377_05840 [Galliscardovia ingluviei]|uniref:Colicin transporter n=1 Tax=Galliscardovia ingluviei TaxID=1769422 RepID=A0A8J3EY13_9BIFI|nr:hypothetical protein [Galliscardovia ingluviei]GGI13414.1 hypothetical protein GCM10007377_05840 [Galliscardovia ingluviei]
MQQAIDQAKQRLADKKLRDIKQLTTETLNNAVNAVNQSVEAKRQADEQAATQSANSAQSYTGNSWTGGGYATPRSTGNGGGYTAPQGGGNYTPTPKQGRSAKTPTTPAPSQGGSSSSEDEWVDVGGWCINGVCQD